MVGKGKSVSCSQVHVKELAKVAKMYAMQRNWC
jgi:hypothetical protein